MALFVPVTDEWVCPEGPYERAVMDMKRSANKDKPFEMAKDVAAFANHLGGTIVIGLKLQGEKVHRFPMQPSETTEIQELYSKVVAQRCRPMPTVDFAQPTIGDGLALAINVYPSLGQLVGVLAKRVEAEEYGGDAWAFPIRTAIDTDWIQPERFAMFNLPELRRTLILLESIPPKAHVWIRQNQSGGLGPYDQVGYIETIKATANVVWFRMDPHHAQRQGAPKPFDEISPTSRKAFPIDLIETIYESLQGWQMQVAPFR